MFALLLLLLFGLGLFLLYRRRRGRGGRLRARPTRLAAARALEVDGTVRRYVVHRPSTLAPESPCGCVLAFHGGGGDVAGFAERMQRLADMAGLLLAVPEGEDGHWRDGRPEAGPIDRDLAFVEALMRQLEADENVDPGRFWAMGFSNGGMLCLQLAVRMGARFRAIVIGLASRPEAAPGPAVGMPTVPLLFLHGRDDPIMPFEGGEVQRSRRRGLGGRVAGLWRTAEEWIAHAGCGAPEVSRYRRAGDGAELAIYDHRGPGPRAHVVVMVAERTGHAMPTGSYAEPGKAGAPVPAAAFLIRFLALHGHRPPPGAQPRRAGARSAAAGPLRAG